MIAVPATGHLRDNRAGMRILGADVRDLTSTGGAGTIVALDAGGTIASTAACEGIAGLAREVARLTGGEPFLLAVAIPVCAPDGVRSRRVDGWISRRLGVRIPVGRAGGPTSPSGPDVLTALATAGHPCLPYPDRDRRRSGLAEIHPELVLKALAWEAFASTARDLPDREAVLRALPVPEYRGARASRLDWAQRWALVDAALRWLGAPEGVDLRPAREELARAASVVSVDRAAALLDAALLASTARRYLEEPERTAFVGERERGFMILPADALVRRVALREPARGLDRGTLFPRASIQQRLAPHAALRPLELLDLPGRSPRIEAVFEDAPLYEFDNLDEMLWWKHCRHLAGPELPADGLHEMLVTLENDPASDATTGLRLARSRHKTLSFRFEPPQSWRARVAPRDGKTYRFRVLRSVFEG